jgi:hypothetical protein
MEGKVYFKIRYSITTAPGNHGEFSQNQNVLIQTFKSETNDLNEIFTDLFGLHRHEGIVGLEILSVEESYHEPSPEHYLNFLTNRYQ